MPTRILRDSIISSPSLARCSPGAQDRFPRYTLAADDFGCFETAPIIVKGKLYPYRADMTEKLIKADLGEYERERMLEIWEENGRTYGFFVTWGRHQRVREPDPADSKKKFTSRRKTPVPPSVRQFGTLAAYYKAEADRVFERDAGTPPSIAGQLPGTPPSIAERCPPQSQSQSQSQAKTKEEKTSADEPPAPKFSLLSQANKTAKAKKAPTEEEQACRKAIHDRINAEFFRASGAAFDWGAEAGKENAGAAKLATACKNDPTEAMRLIDASIAKAAAGDRLFAERGLLPSFLAGQVNVLRKSRATQPTGGTSLHISPDARAEHQVPGRKMLPS